MSESKKHYRVFVSAAEPSADAHCANLITSLKNKGISIEFAGIGGPKMQEAGCDLLENTVEKASMIYNALANITYFHKLLKRIKQYFANNKVDIVIVCDSPAFNFHVAKAAKQSGIKTLFYVAPQLWAWGAWRIGKLRKSCDKLCCILPFEEEWFSSRGIDATFVGNPLLDDSEIKVPDTKKLKTKNSKLKTIALMPGSRDAEIKSLWQPMQQIATALKKKHPDINFTTVALNNKKLENLKTLQIPGFECEYVIDSVGKTASSVDFTIVASGSATLEVASAGCPMAIMYQSNMILWHLLGRWLIKTKYLSLVNILAGHELVPEFMPYFRSVEPIIETIDSLLNDSKKLEQISISLHELVEPLAKMITRDEVAKIAMEMLNKES
ncbi:MAG: lipid-A-disaccharide synthase [Sedimentisphaerales bacterium]|nr:lipid-A-disaccharide synthase [Sedimentisphaerales bacterium]